MFPLVIAEAVAEIIFPVALLEAIENSLFVVSHPKPVVSLVILLAPLKKAICPEVPLPDTPPAPTVQVTIWLLPSRQRAEPVLEERLVRATVPATVVVSFAEAI